MPNIVRVSRRVKLLEISFYILLLCFVIPIRIKNLDVEKQFDDYLRTFNKTYDDHSIYQNKLTAFKNSLEDIEKLNANRTTPSSASYGLTKYSDMLPEEFIKNRLLHNFSSYLEKNRGYVTSLKDQSVGIIKRAVTTVPSKVDWRSRNAVTPVANQQSCGACWAFAAVEITESQYAIKTGKLQKLSVQKMIDCAKNNDGCDGGDVYALLDWIKEKNVTLVEEGEYPLTLNVQKCRNTSSRGVWIDDFECGNFIGSEELIIQLLAKHGPVAVAINAISWQNYVKGIIQFHCDSSTLKLNHAVQIVGYDLTAEIPHYIVRNSWGMDFGDDGYLYIAIGDNLCGLAREVCIVEIL